MKKVFIDNLLEFDRLQLRTLVGIYTGYCGVRHHMHRIGLAENAECRLCLDDETMEHVLCQCPAAARLRLSLLGAVTVRLKGLKGIALSTLVCFIKKLGLLGYI